jgi:hypothetical protein
MTALTTTNATSLFNPSPRRSIPLDMQYDLHSATPSVDIFPTASRPQRPVMPHPRRA